MCACSPCPFFPFSSLIRLREVRLPLLPTVKIHFLYELVSQGADGRSIAGLGRGQAEVSGKMVICASTLRLLPYRLNFTCRPTSSLSQSLHMPIMNTSKQATAIPSHRTPVGEALSATVTWNAWTFAKTESAFPRSTLTPMLDGSGH